MKRGLSLCVFRTNLPDPELLAFVREQGFEYLDGNAYSSQEIVDSSGGIHVEQARTLYESTGMQLHSLHGPCVDLSSSDTEEREDALRRCMAAADALRALGGNILVMHPAWPHDATTEASTRMTTAVESLQRLAEYCEAGGIRLAVENLLPAEGFSSSREILEIVERVGGSTGVCFDSCHASLSKEGLVAMITALAPHVIATHLSDSFLRDDDHYPPGLGIQDLPAVIATLAAAGFAGVCNFEMDMMSPRRVVRATASWIAEQTRHGRK